MSLFQELKRRNVFKVAAAYVIVSWLMLQISDTLVPALHLPEWFHSGVAFVLILGFPVAITFAWAFELTPEGIKREHEVDRSESITHETSRKLNVVITAMLVLALGYFIWESRYKAREDVSEDSATTESVQSATDEGVIPEPIGTSIAVLPFVNMSNDPDQEYFSDGISEELLNVLVKYPDLRVAARTSSFQFKGANIDIGDIARQLRVNHILEGSVRKSGTRLRITAQLIEAKTGFHLWSETYDRELDDIFAIQDEISAAIGQALKIQLALGSGSDQAAPTVLKAANPEAFDAYMQGRQLINLRGRRNLEQALTHLEQAVQLDEAYAPAQAQLAIAIALLNNGPSGYGDLTLIEIKQRATPHIKRAFELEQNLAEAYGARAIMAMVESDYQRAIEYITQALALNPSYADALNWSYISYARLGLYSQAIQSLERLVSIDPLSVVGRANLSTSLAVRGQLQAAQDMADSIAGQNQSSSYVSRGMITNDVQGEPAEALRWFLKAYALVPDDTFSNAYNSLIFAQLDLIPEALRFRSDVHHWAYLSLRMWPDLIENLQQRLANDPSSVQNKMFLANALHSSGEVELAQPLYEEMIALRPGIPLIDLANDSVIPMARAVAGRLRSGDTEGAAELVRLANEDLRQRSLAGLHESGYYQATAMLQALAGNDEAAMKTIEDTINAAERDRALFSEPAFDTLKEAPKFLELESKLAQILASEREKALQMICFNNPVPEAWQPLPETCVGVERAQ